MSISNPNPSNLQPQGDTAEDVCSLFQIINVHDHLGAFSARLQIINYYIRTTAALGLKLTTGLINCFVYKMSGKLIHFLSVHMLSNGFSTKTEDTKRSYSFGTVLPHKGDACYCLIMSQPCSCQSKNTFLRTKYPGSCCVSCSYLFFLTNPST